jgi:hypothetical protein
MSDDGHATFQCPGTWQARTAGSGWSAEFGVVTPSRRKMQVDHLVSARCSRAKEERGDRPLNRFNGSSVVWGAFCRAYRH